MTPGAIFDTRTGTSWIDEETRTAQNLTDLPAVK